MPIKMLRGVSLFSVTLLMAGCVTPFSNKVSQIDWSGPAAPGTIAVSQPKMYQRASLINERRLEAEWLDQQLEASKTIEFKPEIVREVEQITAFAAALGLSFDPAGALNYKRASETGTIQQQIDVMKVQLQLDQLKRDAELVRATFPSQATPLNVDLGKVGSGSVTPATSAAGAAAADQLTAAIARLNTALTTRLDVEAKAPALAATASNPADVFRDRAAYRDLLKAARNASSLDDLHDAGGGALIRLNFQAMVLPESARVTAPGVVQMRLIKPELTRIDRERIYKGWLEHINESLNVPTDTGWEPNVALLASAAADNFDQLEYRYELAGSAAPAVVVGKGKKGVASREAEPIPADCPGIVFGQLANPDRCGVLALAVPKLAGSIPQEKGYVSPDSYLTWFNERASEVSDQKRYVEFHALLLKHATAVVQECKLQEPAAMLNGDINEAYVLFDAIKEAQIRTSAGDVFSRAERIAQRILLQQGIKARGAGKLNKLIATRAARARQFLATFESVALSRCTNDQLQAFHAMAARLYVPPGFVAALTGSERIAVYEIGPREQMQQISSVARVANNFSLAAALAGSAPSSGVGARAAADYSRQATGKAATIERVPGLIGYSQSKDTFGWVIGPKVTFDPKGNLQLQQTPRALDLSVDLTLPGWWPWFEIETVTGWAPATDAIANGSIEILGQKTSQVLVPMVANYSDYEVLSARVKLGGLNENRTLLLDDAQLRGQSVNACRGTSVFIRGANVWRTASVLVNGHRLNENAITVAPDMSGILLAVPALDELLGEVARPKVPLSVFTRYHTVSGEIDYVRKPPAGCKPSEKKPAADGPEIATFAPTQFQAGMELTFTIFGSKLNQINQVTLNGQPGVVEADKDGKRLRAKFSAANTSSLPVSRTIALSFYKDNEKVSEKLVEVTANKGDK